MRVKVPSRFRKNEYLALIIEMARVLEPDVYCELGIYEAYTFNRMLPYVGHGIGIDIRDKRVHITDTHDNWEFFKGTSKEFVEKYSGPKIDLLFIDADHTATAVIQDLENLKPHIKPETGMVLLHDTYPVRKDLIQPGYCGNAWEAAKEVHHSLRDSWEIVTIPEPWAGLSILRKLDNQCHGWMDRKE